jgi:O-antigen ligase
LNKYVSFGAKKLPLFDVILFVIYTILFGYFIAQPAIYSPDTNSYWHLDITRYPGYVIFLRTFEFIFGGFFDYAAVGFQLLLAFFSIHIFQRNVSRFFNLNPVLRIILLIILVYPLFPPLSTANNLCSEGLSYPLYLLLLSLILDFLFKDQLKKIYLLAVVFILLALTRGQFAVVIPIVIFMYLIKYRKRAFQKKNIKYLLILILIPFVNNILDSSYRKIVHGHFITTPYSYINAVTLPLYLSTEADSLLLKDPDQRAVFLKTYKRIDSLGLLSSKVLGTDKEKYQLFHDKFPYICNQSFHNIGAKYFFKIHGDPFQNHIDTEQAAKEMFPILLSKHFKEWISLYSISVFRGFGSVFVFLFFILICVVSGWKTLKSFTAENGFVFLSILLIISNAMLVAVAVHTITRYTFYNFALGFLILVILSKKITSKI